MMATLSDDDLRRLRTNTESNWVERKTTNDKNGWLRTAVAFANSMPMDMPAVLLVGVKDDGTVEKKIGSDHNWEQQQKSVTAEIQRAYPPIKFQQKIIDDPDGSYLAVIVPGSSDRPHFTGGSFVRVGPETRGASEAEFDALIAERSRAAYTIRKWIGRSVTVAEYIHGGLNPKPCTLTDCNTHYFTVQFSSSYASYPLSRTEISFNHHVGCLQLEVRELP